MENVGRDEEETMDEFWNAKAGMFTEENRGFLSPDYRMIMFHSGN
jgi:hypothetical protein